MTRTREWPVRVMYLLIAAALVISLIIVASPSQKAGATCTADVCAEWDKVPTPSELDWVLSPRSYVVDANVADGGEVAYSIVKRWDTYPPNYYLLKSDDYAATWSDITDALEKLLDMGDPADPSDDDYIIELLRVATDWEDSEFVAVALWWYDMSVKDDFLNVFFSTDGGDTFKDAGEVDPSLYYVSDLAVSYEAGGKRDIVIGGEASIGYGAGLFRCTVTGDSASAWWDLTDTGNFPGWDNAWSGDGNTGNDLQSWLVTDIAFSPSWATDKTILVTTVEDAPMWYNVFLQSGSLGTSPGWNERSTLGIEAVSIEDDVELPTWLLAPGYDARAIAGIALPDNYNSKTTDTRILWVWVDFYNGPDPASQIVKVDNEDSFALNDLGQIKQGKVFLTNISYKGSIEAGEAIAGVLGDGLGDYALCCQGVQVYRKSGIVNMEICCETWKKACKPPTGVAGMGVWYVGDNKAYAVAMGDAGPYDESAWSVTFDDGDTWNQLSLIDTQIDYLSDVAVSPDCNKTMLVSVNVGRGSCYCDSVWLYAVTLPEAEEYSGKWLRTWCGSLEGDNQGDLSGGYFPWVPERGLLRLAPEETNGETVFLVDRMSGNVYRNDLETLACWDPIGTTEVDYIVDLVAQDADTLFALDFNGDVAMFSEDEWQESVDSKVDNGWTIAVKGDDILVGGQNSDVSHSDDGGATFTALEDVCITSGAHVTVAFDSYFNSNDTIYAALANAGDDNGIYLYVIGESTSWHNLNALPLDYTGLVLDRPSPGNPMTSAETGGVLYASYRAYYFGYVENCCCKDGCDEWYSGVARCLTPIVQTCCGGGQTEWDYLTWGLTPLDGEGYEDFNMPPQALKICGCLTADSNSHLFVIDNWDGYDMDEGEWGTVWTFEDCYSKKAVELKSPVDGFVVPADPCECDNIPFTIRWDRLCDACCYDIEFAMDEDFTQPVDILHWFYYDLLGELPDGDGCESYCPLAPLTPSMWVPSDQTLTCEFTYYWRVRAAQAETCQEIHSWWSEPQSFTVAPSQAAAAITLVSPEPGATGISKSGLGFSWKLTASADNYDWVLSKNADLSSPTESKAGLTSTAYGCTKILDYDTTYYWQVTAYKEGSAISMSAIGTFRTMAEAEEPGPVEQPATPFWVWVVIAIGAVLVIVVIVLIFRTRRV